jgi:hypothetical protein
MANFAKLKNVLFIIKRSMQRRIIILFSMLLCLQLLYADDIPMHKRNVPVTRTPIFVPFSAFLENGFITYQSTISYTGVTVEIEDENGVVVESQTLNIVAGTAYTISVTGLDAGEYSIA